MPPPPPESLAEVLLPWAQLLGVLLAALALGAAWTSALASRRSAAASERTARRADLTSRRAARALSRATSPDPQVWLISWEDPGTPTAVMWEVEIRNQRAQRGFITAVRLSRSDGYRCATTTSLPVAIGGSGIPLEPDARMQFPVGPVPPAIRTGVAFGAAAAPVDAPGYSVTVEIEVEFSDPDRVATWCQVTRFREVTIGSSEEIPGSMPREFRPRWQFDLIGRDAPRAVDDDGQ